MSNSCNCARCGEASEQVYSGRRSRSRALVYLSSRRRCVAAGDGACSFFLRAEREECDMRMDRGIGEGFVGKEQVGWMDGCWGVEGVTVLGLHGVTNCCFLLI